MAWTRFRTSILKTRGKRCELCGRAKTARQLDLHHVTPDAYTLLEPHRFKLLCTGCHEFVENIVWVAKTMPRSAEFLAWAGDFLPRKGLD